LRPERAAVGSGIFFALAPGVVAGVAPWWMTRWHRPEGAGRLSLAVGVALIAAALAALLYAFGRFVGEGKGTPAPVAPTERLVVGGPYRYVRNPMYLAVVGAIAGQALALESARLAAYGLSALAAMFAFVRRCEEPRLARRFGADYDAYRREVPGWWPRLTPWRRPAPPDRSP